MNQNELQHVGVLGMKWGVRRYQNEDGSATSSGKNRIHRLENKITKNEKNITRNLNKTDKILNRKILLKPFRKGYSALAETYKKQLQGLKKIKVSDIDVTNDRYNKAKQLIKDSMRKPMASFEKEYGIKEMWM